MQVSNGQQIEVNIVGGSIFGRYAKISEEKTYNMFVSDNWLVNYAGYENQINLLLVGKGRGLFNSIRGGFLIAVVGSTVFKLDTSLSPVIIGTIGTSEDQVYIDENLNSQICIVDGTSAYIYNYSISSPPNFMVQTLTVTPPSGPTYNLIPSYVSYHNTFFLFGSSPSPQNTNSSDWFAFLYSSPLVIQFNSLQTLQTKPDIALAVHRLPGRGNNVLVLGSAVAEVWTQVGGLENYRRVQSFNIDNGLISIASLAANDDFLCWLGQNENNSPCIMFTDGSSTKRLSTDGIDYVLSSLKFPEQSTAFFYRQDGHIFYQITFYNPVDNLTLFYDFNTGVFFNASDENLNYYPARSVVFFNGGVYFISINDGGFYRMDTNFLTYNYIADSPINSGEEIPHIRICKTIRKPDSDRFRVGKFSFWMEQGVNNFYLIPSDTIQAYRPRVDMSFSKNGNQSYSNIVSRYLNPDGQYKNQIRWERMGQANEFTIQLKFVGFQRFICNNGVAEIY